MSTPKQPPPVEWPSEWHRCEDGWLPDDGETDSIALDEGDGPYGYTQLLIPTCFIPCFQCNPESWLNGDLNA